MAGCGLRRLCGVEDGQHARVRDLETQGRGIAKRFHMEHRARGHLHHHALARDERLQPVNADAHLAGLDDKEYLVVGIH